MTLTLAVPSKGRIRDDALATLERAGLAVEPPADARSYRAAVPGMPGLDVAFLSASEIATELAAGRVAIGITGEDLAREAADDMDAVMTIEARLGFGRADVVVALPATWFDVGSMLDLADVAAGFRARHGHRLRVATKYRRLTRRHFTVRHGIRAYRIVQSLGATEGAPHAGLADCIVDITSTGSTLRANDLKVPEGGLVLASEACLIAAKTPRLSLINASLSNEIVTRLRESAGRRD